MPLLTSLIFPLFPCSKSFLLQHDILTSYALASAPHLEVKFCCASKDWVTDACLVLVEWYEWLLRIASVVMFWQEFQRILCCLNYILQKLTTNQWNLCRMLTTVWETQSSDIFWGHLWANQKWFKKNLKKNFFFDITVSRKNLGTLLCSFSLEETQH